MEIGKTYGYREPPWEPGKPLQPVELLQFGPKKSSKVRIKLLDGAFGGLDLWVPKRRLEVLWDKAAAYLLDEIHLAEVATASRASRPAEEEIEAAWLVFYAYPRPDGILMEWRGSPAIGSVEISEFDAVCLELGLNGDHLLGAPTAFVDRGGTFHAPWSVTRELALRVAERYAPHVLEHVAEEEKELQNRCIHGEYSTLFRKDKEIHIPPESYLPELRKMEPVFALARRWCGERESSRFDEAVRLRGEIDRLRTQLERAARDLEALGHPRAAQNYRNALRADSV